ncbi:UDP-N-acetylglucosamine 1-carboxyvinyltransferase [Candidatus Neomarinimicrobiota bacterium]
MDAFLIEGQHPLSGTVEISGAKNAVLPIMAAALLTSGITTLSRVPNLKDTRTMGQLMEIIGAKVDFDNHKLVIDASGCSNPEAPYELVKTMRASFYVLGPLLARFGRCRVSMPGGCNWGPRPIDLHLQAMEALGATITLEGGYIIAEGKLRGAEINFEISSVGATGNTIMAVVMAEGITTINNAAREPEIVDLCHFLQAMGANIDGIGTATLIIEGRKELGSSDWQIIPDRIEAGTFLVAGAMLGQGVVIDGARPDHLGALIAKLEEAGVEIEIDGELIKISKPDKINPVNIVTSPYPGYPTDLQAQWISLMLLADGNSLIQDNIYLDRFAHVPELARLGAEIKLDHNIAQVQGPAELVGAPVMSTDIRASAALVLAALIANGETTLSRVYHIDRGYESIEEKFNGLGAKIRRVGE